ncbi:MULTISPECIES: sulfite exporter TauE/SafE family protein [Hyphobacterium]|uniref:Sulfite exporter TauE/SafE family protein n=1 Tax=Hyphobacterium vulgare TaxID=1736751 RepID=A0ABV7A116_9PROT
MDHGATASILTHPGFAGGVLAGFASTLHCAVMCGGIGSAVMFSLSPGGSLAARAGLLATAQAGKWITYITLGALAGWLGSGLLGFLDPGPAHLVTRWLAAVTLVWIGLSITGVLPPFAAADRVFAPVTRRLVQSAGFRAAGRAAPVVAGLVWGLLPCGLVYAVLLLAMSAGSALDGAVVMAGFGLGVIPGVTATALGFGSLAKLGQAAQIRGAAGLAIAALGMASVAYAPAMAWICR